MVQLTQRLVFGWYNINLFGVSILYARRVMECVKLGTIFFVLILAIKYNDYYNAKVTYNSWYVVYSTNRSFKFNNLLGC